MYLNFKKHLFLQMLAVGSYLSSSVNAEEYIVDFVPSSVDETLKEIRSNGEIQELNFFPRITDGVMEMSPEMAHKVAEMPGVNRIEKVENNIKAFGWPDEKQPEARAGRKLAEDVPYGINMVRASEVPYGGSPKKVCVVDTGYDNGHEDLPEAFGGHSPYGSTEKWDVDGHGHGTHCAGTIGAIGDNDKGVVGVVKQPGNDFFYIGKGLTNSGSGSTSGVMAAVAQCVENGADIVSMSLGGGGYSSTFDQSFKDYYEDGVLIIAAAGNSGTSSKSYPASYPHVMSVAAVDSNQNKAGFSQYNDQVEIAAPGVGVKSTLPKAKYPAGYASWSGTSMATPHVAGVAALVWSNFPECSNHDIRTAMVASAVDRGTPGCDTSYGFGIVDAKAAYDYLKTNGCSGQSPVVEGGCDMNTGPPTTAPPTAAPTAFDCPSPGKKGEYSIKIDNYGQETDWVIKDSQGTTRYSGGDYAKGSTTVVDVCLEPGDYTHKITDDYGDGICCNYGNGYYKLVVDGITEVEGGQFGSSEEKSFTIEGSSGDCKSWCANIPIPWTGGATEKCTFTGHCDGCSQCN